MLIQFILSKLKMVWMKNNESDCCLVCARKWSLLLRRHHCRACGRLVCADCSKGKVMNEKTSLLERCCSDCITQKQTNVVFERNASIIIGIDNDDTFNFDETSTYITEPVPHSTQITFNNDKNQLRHEAEIDIEHIDFVEVVVMTENLDTFSSTFKTVLKFPFNESTCTVESESKSIDIYREFYDDMGFLQKV